MEQKWVKWPQKWYQKAQKGLNPYIQSDSVTELRGAGASLSNNRYVLKKGGRWKRSQKSLRSRDPGPRLRPSPHRRGRFFLVPRREARAFFCIIHTLWMHAYIPQTKNCPNKSMIRQDFFTLFDSYAEVGKLSAFPNLPLSLRRPEEHLWPEEIWWASERSKLQGKIAQQRAGCSRDC